MKLKWGGLFMKAYIIRRVLYMIPIALLVGVIAFFLVQLSPGDPATFFVSPDAPQEQVELVRERLGLDQPIMVRFVNWGTGVLKGDLGYSFFQRRPVTESYAAAFPYTLQLAVGGLFFALLIAIPIGIISALKQNTFVDDFARIFVLTGISFPNFWFGMLLILLFAVNLGWLPSQGLVMITDDFFEAIKYSIMPWITLGYLNAALIARMTRSSMLDVMRKDYIRTARAKGLLEKKVIFKHALKNAVNPILTVTGLATMRLIAGSVVIETVFNVPGIGRLVVNSVSRRDYPVIQGALLITAMLIVLVNLSVDLMYAIFDPRIRYE